MKNNHSFYYLYGKNEHLSPLFKDYGQIRFRDIASLIELENESIRDNELVRKYYLDHTKYLFQIKDHVIAPGDIVAPVKIELSTRRCHVLCLSKKEYSQIMFERFKANICLKINVSFLVRLLESTFGKSGCRILHREVLYLSNILALPSNKSEDLVFIKNDKYKIEEEYRVALFYPYDEKTAYSSNGRRVNMFGEHKYIDFGMEAGCGMSVIVQEARDNSGNI